MRPAPQRCRSECSERTWDLHTAANSWPPTTSVGLPRALEEPERYAGRVIPLAGDELSIGDIIRTFKTVTGRKPWVAPIPAFLAKRAMPKEFLDMFRWIREKGFKANIAEVRQEYPQLLTFAGWVKKYTDEH